MAEAIRAGRLSSVEAVETCLDRIRRENPRLNAVVTVDAEGARRAATAADAVRATGAACGPLHGVPITIKDSFETAGLRTVSGDRSFAQHIPLRDAPPIARLRDAGAIVIGKTNLPALASGIQTDNAVFGRTNNPWDTGRTPGGSSGGAAAAIAAGLSCLDLGSDIGGSIRIPAHFCGVFGLKTTGGRVSGAGHLASRRRLVVPHGWEPLRELAAFGPIARSVDDLRLTLPVIADSTRGGLERPPSRPGSVTRIAWTRDFGGAPLSEDSREVIERLGSGLARGGGCAAARAEPPGFDYDEAWYVAGVCLGAMNSLLQSPFVRVARSLIGPIMSACGPRDALMQGLAAGASQRVSRVRDALARRERLIDDIERFLGAWDAWICPVFPGPAFTHRSPHAPIDVDGRRVSVLRANLLHSVIFNLTGHPAVAIPAGQSREGLPIGVQAIGRRWGEMALLDVADEIMKAARGYRRPPCGLAATEVSHADNH